MFDISNEHVIVFKELIDEDFTGNNMSETELLNTFKSLFIKVKDKKYKNKHFNEVSGYLMSNINIWNTKSIINILVNNYNDSFDSQNIFFLDCVDYLVENNSYQVKYHLIELIENVKKNITNLRKHIKEKAVLVMNKLVHLSGNKDLDPFLPIVTESLQDFNKIPSAIEKLAGCIFVQNIEYSALAVILPILERGLKSNNTEIKRKSCIIIDNMCKLVQDPKEIYPLICIFKPLISDCAENISNPEARNVASKSLETLTKCLGKNFVFHEFNINTVQNILEEKLKLYLNNKFSEFETEYKNNILYLSGIITNIVNIKYFEYEEWVKQFSKYLCECIIDNNTQVSPLLSYKEVGEICQEMFNKLSVEIETDEIYIDEEEGFDLYKGKFSLAYGTLTLLNNTHIHLKKNRFYGLLGPNNCGKTTLMRAIVNEQVEGFPKRDELKTIFVEHEIDEREVGEDKEGYPILNIDLCGIDWVVDCCNEVYKMNPSVTRDNVEKVMEDIGFGNTRKNPGNDRAADCEMGVTTYSGGWKMKMQLCAATLMNADILMLDEPTGHLDVTNIEWLKKWLSDFKNNGGSIICTSHDSGFLNEMCSHIIDFQDRKLITFRDKKGDVLKKFVENYPEKNGYFVLKNDVMKFTFPEPKLLEGTKSASKAILKMKNVYFQFPIRDKPTVMDINLSCSMSSRVAVIGPNGAGKSTAIKLLIGELKPTSGEVWRNGSARIAYVAQHAFQHLEKHITKTPKEYILWRFAGNDDKESIDFKADNDNDEIEIKKYFLKFVENGYEVVPCNEKDTKFIVLDTIFTKRKTKSKDIEYEVSWKNHDRDLRIWVNKNILINMGNLAAIQRFDEKMTLAAGLTTKSLTSTEVEKHLNGFGLDAEQSSHTPISSLSGGQKVKVVLAASLWLNPHLVILDEPTNYIDRDGLGALTKAIEDFKGGVVIISHNREFANAVSQEKWIMEKGRLRKEGDSIANTDNHIKDDQSQTVVKDSWGNDVEIEQQQKELTPQQKKKEIRKLEKQIRLLRKEKKEDDDEIFILQDKIDLLKI